MSSNKNLPVAPEHDDALTQPFVETSEEYDGSEGDEVQENENHEIDNLDPVSQFEELRARVSTKNSYRKHLNDARTRFSLHHNSWTTVCKCKTKRSIYLLKLWGIKFKTLK